MTFSHFFCVRQDFSTKDICVSVVYISGIVVLLPAPLPHIHLLTNVLFCDRMRSRRAGGLVKKDIASCICFMHKRPHKRLSRILRHLSVSFGHNLGLELRI